MFTSRIHRLRSAGFSLVEVVIALGLVSFCLVALMGLLAVSMNTSTESTTATADTLLFQEVVNQLRVASIERYEAQTSSSSDPGRFPLPAAGTAGDSKTFTVDEFNRYLADGAATSDPKAARVVTINIMNPVKFEQEGGEDAVPLGSTPEEGGQIAVVGVTVQAAHGKGKESPSVFSTELNLATQ